MELAKAVKRATARLDGDQPVQAMIESDGVMYVWEVESALVDADTGQLVIALR